MEARQLCLVLLKLHCTYIWFATTNEMSRKVWMEDDSWCVEWSIKPYCTILCYYTVSSKKPRHTYYALQFSFSAAIEYLHQDAPEFIPPDLWSPNSPDLNRLDYNIWGSLQDRVYQKCIRDVDELKQILVEVWSDFGQTIVDRENW